MLSFTTALLGLHTNGGAPKIIDHGAAAASFTDSLSRRAVMGSAAAAAAATGMSPASAGFFDGEKKDWEVVNLPILSETAPILFDIEFDTKDPKLGWIVGNRGTFLQTNDAGKSWNAKSFANLDPDEEINYRFTKVSFQDGEGWIIGKPAILLHTRDGGSSWERVPLSPKLPGDPSGIVALGPGKAEMSTTAGAIYTTENAGRNWKAQVQETIDATLNRVSSSGVQVCAHALIHQPRSSSSLSHRSAKPHPRSADTRAPSPCAPPLPSLSLSLSLSGRVVLLRIDQLHPARRGRLLPRRLCAR